jgi:hypothetical protein
MSRPPRLAIRPDDPGSDALYDDDAPAQHWAEMLAIVEADLDRPMPMAERDSRLAMKRYWGAALDRRLAQLANGAKPSRSLLDNPPGHPRLMAAIGEAVQHA